MDYQKMIDELRTAWDALEALSVSGYSTRMRIQTAQEGILAVYTELEKAKKAEEEKEPATIPADE